MNSVLRLRLTLESLVGFKNESEEEKNISAIDQRRNRLMFYATRARAHTSQWGKLPRTQERLTPKILSFAETLQCALRKTFVSILDKHQPCLYQPLEIIIVFTVGQKAVFCFDVCLIGKNSLLTMILTSFIINFHHVELCVLLLPSEEF